MQGPSGLSEFPGFFVAALFEFPSSVNSCVHTTAGQLNRRSRKACPVLDTGTGTHPRLPNHINPLNPQNHSSDNPPTPSAVKPTVVLRSPRRRACPEPGSPELGSPELVEGPKGPGVGACPELVEGSLRPCPHATRIQSLIEDTLTPLPIPEIPQSPKNPDSDNPFPLPPTLCGEPLRLDAKGGPMLDFRMLHKDGPRLRMLWRSRAANDPQGT